MKFITFTKLLAIVNAFIMQIAYSLSVSKAKSNNFDTYSYAVGVDSEKRTKRSKPELFKSIYAPMILAGDADNDLKIQSFGTFYTKRMFAPSDEPEAEGLY